MNYLLEKDGAFLPLMTFREEPADPVDFVPLNTFCACSADEPFLHKNMVKITTENGRYSIGDNVLRITEAGIVREIILETETQLRDALKTYFGISYSGKLRVKK